MNYLLDTCAFLWLVNGSEELLPRAREAVATPTATLYLSVLTAAEIATKAGKGRIELPSPPESWVRDAARLHHLTLLLLELEPAVHAGTLPWIHSDSFDRILVATALLHSLPIVTPDEAIAPYQGIQILW